MLDGIGALDFDVLVPGHGPVQRDRTYFTRLRGLIAFVVAEVERSARRGDTEAEILARLRAAAPVVGFVDADSDAARVMISFFLRPAVRRALELR